MKKAPCHQRIAVVTNAYDSATPNAAMFTTAVNVAIVTTTVDTATLPRQST